MMILNTEIDESIVLDGEITITVLSVRGKQVRIGFNAPDEVRIHRAEIYKRIKAEKLAAVDACGADNFDAG